MHLVRPESNELLATTVIFSNGFEFDGCMDDRVYLLYDLTAHEIKLVNGRQVE
jgi:hypothetical protein